MLFNPDPHNVVETILQIVENRLRAGESVKISCFGTFTVKHEHSRRGRDPKTGVPVTIDSRRVLSFKASQVLKDLVAETDSACRSAGSSGISSCSTRSIRRSSHK